MKQRRQITINGFGLIMVACLIFFLATSLTGQGTADTLTRQEYMEAVDAGNVTSAIVKQNKETPTGQLILLMKDNSHRQMYVSDVTAEQDFLMEKNVPFTTQDVPHESYMMTMILPMVLSTGMVVLVIMFMNARAAGGGSNAKMMNFGKSRAKLSKDANKFNFKKVAGLHEEKVDLEELVDFLRDPQKYTSLGARIPKGVLLVGPPGTGKTLLAKAVAGESGVPFFSISGSDFVEMFVGVGASRVRDLFEEAKQNAPCIVFIDEIDAVARQRGTGLGGGHDEREQTLNQLLAEMDGFDSSKGIIILAATNRPEILDKALLRPGRFDRRIIVERPDLKGRIDVLKVHAKNVCMDETVDFKEIALATSGAVGSDLANIINEAALLAVRNGRNAVSQSDLFESVEVVIAGKAKKDRVLSAEERRIVSYHEVGHALVAALQKNTEPVQKITIIPRTMGALGYVMQVPEEEKYLMSEKQIREELVTMLAGRAAESIVFDSVTTGASNDIEQATKLARAMITQYGMSEKFGLIGLTTVEDQYLGGRATLNCGEATAAEIDQEVMKILKAAYDQALALLADNRDCLDKIAAFLIERETITGKEFMKIFREVKGIPDSETEQAEANVSNPAENDSQPDGQDEPTLVEAKTDNGASSESDINVSLETKAED